MKNRLEQERSEQQDTKVADVKRASIAASKELREFNSLFDYTHGNPKYHSSFDPNKQKLGSLDLLAEFNSTFLDQPKSHEQQPLQQVFQMHLEPHSLQQPKKDEPHSNPKTSATGEFERILASAQMQRDELQLYQPEADSQCAPGIAARLESNDEDEEVDVAAPPINFKPKEKYASIVISDDEEQSACDDLKLVTKKALQNQINQQLKTEPSPVEKKVVKPLFPFFSDTKKPNNLQPESQVHQQDFFQKPIPSSLHFSNQINVSDLFPDHPQPKRRQSASDTLTIVNRPASPIPQQQPQTQPQSQAQLPQKQQNAILPAAFTLDEDLFLPEPRRQPTQNAPQIQNKKNNSCLIIDVEEDAPTQKTNGKSTNDDVQVKQKQEEVRPKPLSATANNDFVTIIQDLPNIEEEGQVQDMELLHDWVQITSISDLPNPKFQGFSRVPKIEDRPRDIIKTFYGDQRFSELLKLLAVSEHDFWLWLGIKIMMGYMKLPDQNEYFFREDWVAGGGIRSVITQQGFEEVEEKVDIVQPQMQNQSMLAVKLESNNSQHFYQEFLPWFISDLNERFKKTVSPGQELLLIQNQSLLPYSNQIDWFQLIDRQSGFILHQFFWNNPDKKKESIIGHRDLQKRLRKMFEPYHLNRHIVYSNGILDAESVMLLHSNKVYVCTDLKGHQLLPGQPQQSMAYFTSKHKEPLFLFYKSQWVTFASQHSLTQRNSILQQLNAQMLNEEKLYVQPPQSPAFKPSQLLFTFIIESIIHNVACITRQPNFKAFRADLALHLIDKSINFQDPVPLTKKKPESQRDHMCQTEMTIGVINDQLFHCPVHDGNARCLVCLKSNNLSKTSASCIGCSKALNHKIYICVYPCFKQFHRYPELYLNPEEYYQVVSGYDQYFVDDDDNEDPNLPLKPDTSNLDQMYLRTHADFNEDLMPHAIPINYEDNFRQKTKFKIIHTSRPLPRGRQPRIREPKGGKPKGTEQLQGQQSGAGQQIEQEPKRAKKGQKKQQNQQEVVQEGDPETSRNAMMDFFQMVRKKVMSQKPNQTQQSLQGESQT